MGEIMFNDLELAQIKVETLIPHSGGMCLLEKIMECSPEKIICQTQTHLDESNPLKIEGSLSKMHLIEYGAQAVAVHGGLIERLSLSKLEPRLGYIALLKSIKWGTIDPASPFLEVKAHFITANDMSKLYEFYVMDAVQQCVCSGQVMVVHPS